VAASEGTIEMAGRVNGYSHSSFASEGVVQPGIEPLVDFPGLEQTHDDPVLGPSEPATEISQQGEQTTTVTDRVMPAQSKTVGRNQRTLDGGNTKTAKRAKPDTPKVKYVPQAELDEELAKLEKLSRAALAGDTAALDKLRVALDNSPHVWQRLADLQRQIELKMIALVAGTDPLRSQVFRRRCSEFRHRILDGEPASLATKMAAGRAVSCWMFCQLLELRALDSPDELRNVKSLEQAERRYQVAMRTFHLSRQADLRHQRPAPDNPSRRA
jgi:hypothetical protein